MRALFSLGNKFVAATVKGSATYNRVSPRLLCLAMVWVFFLCELKNEDNGLSWLQQLWRVQQQTTLNFNSIPLNHAGTFAASLPYHTFYPRQHHIIIVRRL